ncbi:hypothetical protein OAR56_03995, partial [Pelagibacteraceae bacterium]|nr:hypothetical protein [Pelagibacteraceae bacterium]
MKQSISILGSTGSVGLTVFNIVEKKNFFFKVNLLSANKNFKLISHQIKKYKPNFFVITNKDVFKKIQKKFIKSKTVLLNNFDSKNIKISDLTISAIPGIAGLQPTILSYGFDQMVIRTEDKIRNLNIEYQNINNNLTKNQSIATTLNNISIATDLNFSQLLLNRNLLIKSYLLSSIELTGTLDFFNR